MSYTFTLFGTSSVINQSFYPPIKLDDESDYVLGLINFGVYNAIPNVDITNNKFHYDDKIIEIPEGSYELVDINKYIKKKVESGVNVDIVANNNTLKCELKCNHYVNFEPQNSIGRLLGFKPQKLKANTSYTSDFPVSIIKVNAICIECSITTNSYSNSKSVHILHEFFPRAPPGFKIVETPNHVIYLPINTREISSLTLKIVDQDDNLINFRQEVVTVRLHLKKQNGN